MRTFYTRSLWEVSDPWDPISSSHHKQLVFERSKVNSNMEEHAPLSSNLVLTKKTEVPEYLQNGEFYKSLNDDDDEQISVPAHTLKTNALVENNNDLEYLLSSMRFWSVDKVLPEMVNYCLYKNPTLCVAVLETFKGDFRYVDIIMQMIPLLEKERAKLAITSGLLDLVTILRESCCALPDGCHIAAKAGYLDILLFLYEHGGKLDTKAKLDCADGEEVMYVCACSHAAAGGNIACLEYLHKCGRPWEYGVLSAAIWEGQTECVEFALQHGCDVSLDNRYCTAAARMGFLDILKLLHNAGAPWNEHTCSQAARCGKLDCLRYLYVNGCPWDENTCMGAATNGELECLKYAHENGCAWDSLTTSFAASGGHLHCLQYAHENGCEWDESTCSSAAKNGHLDCLRYAHEHGCIWYNFTSYYAAESGHLECLKYLHKNGCNWDGQLCRIAATSGHLECLKFAHENGCEWFKDTCAYAAKNRQLECLKYAHEHGCPWDEETMEMAGKYGHMSCLQYAHEQGCPVGGDLYEVVVRAKKLECAEYIKNCIGDEASVSL